PHFTCRAVGDLLLELLPGYPSCQLTVLAGHTHNVCDLRHLPNLRLCVGAAEYGQPALADVFELN
ncbi:MAG: phosphoesterase, partial [Candidatus Sericytochromatia bacterium]